MPAKINNEIIPLVIPAYEPDNRLRILLDELKQYPDPIIIVDDGSGNRYEDIFHSAKDSGCIIIRNYVNLGKGRALKSAFNFCLNTYDNLAGCITADSDGQHTPDDICRCRDGLRENKDSLIMGCRDFNIQCIPFKSRFGNNITKVVMRYLCGIRLTDTQTGLRGIPRKLMLDSLNIYGERFEFETSMLVEAKKKGFQIMEIPIRTVYDSKKEHSTII